MFSGGLSERHHLATTSTAEAMAPPRKPNSGSPWTDQETTRLIDAYEERWYSLNRGQLRAQQWEEVAGKVAALCGLAAHASKTGTQCRHKIEKLRKRYRSERLRVFRSSWPFFDSIDRMERGPVTISAAARFTLPESYSGEDEDSGEPLESSPRRINGILREAAPRGNSRVLRISLSRKRLAEDDDEEEDHVENEEVEVGCGGGDGEGMSEVAVELRKFGDGYLRMEKRRMEMTREMAREWMEMEAKRAEMAMEAQRYLVEAIERAAFSKKTKNSEDL